MPSIFDSGYFDYLKSTDPELPKTVTKIGDCFLLREDPDDKGRVICFRKFRRSNGDIASLEKSLFENEYVIRRGYPIERNKPLDMKMIISLRSNWDGSEEY